MKKRLLKSSILGVVLSLPLILQSESKAQAAELEAALGPFGKCGASVLAMDESSEPYMNCIYHFFKCQCQIIRD